MGEMQGVRRNALEVSGIKSFKSIKGEIHNQCKDVCFVRAIGVNGSYLEDINSMDRTLMGQMNAGQGYYFRFNELPKVLSAEAVSYYSACYEKWQASGKKEMITHFTERNTDLRSVLGKACAELVAVYSRMNQQATDSMLKNMIVKMLFWFDGIWKDGNFIWDEKKFVKIVASNIEKKQEYFFFYLLTLVGCDVLLLQSRTDIGAEEEALGVSRKFIVGNNSDIEISEYKQVSESRPTISLSTIANRPGKSSSPSVNANREKSFEELARLASSVVMIAVHDEKGEVQGTGSGIMIGKNGYILTNSHVVSGGTFYSVRIEEEEEVYQTDEIIKYNQVLDLALIRIDRLLKPIPIYQGGKELVRGQKVVAIGSPLGLFNSVSDGIISGFRKIDNTDMIQFTAPTSHGSSGGALLNMQGEVIGISTAGIDAGQNINLAMGYECINMFIRGFTNV